MLGILPAALAGFLTAWLVNYLADVLPVDRSITTPRCPTCQHPRTRFRHWLWPGRCPACNQPDPYRIRRVLVLGVYTLASPLLALNPPAQLGFGLGFLVLIYFGLVVVIDVEHRLILHPISLAGALLGLLAGWQVHGLQATLLGGIAGFAIMFVLYQFGELFTRLVFRLRGETIDEVALGFGDVNLAGILGLVLGWPVIVLGLVLTILLGGAGSLGYVILARVLGRYRKFAAIPYAPYLIGAAAFIVFFPDASRAFLSSFFPLFAG